MTVFGAYLLAPVLLAVACLGAGLWIAALRPRIALGALTAPAGMAIIVVLGVVMTYSASTARWTTPVICGVAVLGLPLFAWSRRTTLPSLVRGLDWWPLAVAAAAFVSFAASVAMSGEASWAGWIKLDDTATWLGFTDQLMTAGRAIPEPMTSTFERLIDVNFRGTYGGTGATAYPVGAFPPLGVMSQLAGGDVAWLIHPYMSLLGALLALSLYRLLGAVIGLRWFRALASVVAAQGATLLAYVLWGGIKEILLAMLLTVVAIAVAEASMRGSGWRALVLPVVACLAFLGSTGTPGVGYLAPILIGGLLLGWIVRRPRSGWIATAAVMSAGVTAGVLAVGGLLRPRLSGVPEINDIGNLIAPLNPWQSVGIWLTADFRYSPEYPVATTILIIIAVALAAVGLVAAVRERSWALPLLVGSNLLVLAYSQVSGGAWLAGKAMAVASPAILAAALAGAAAIGRRLRPLAPDPATSSVPVARGWRVCAAGLAAAVILGVLWSNALAYKSVWLAPAAQQAELEAIGREFAGQGPALMTDFSIFGGRHFLRELDTEVAAELRVHEIPLRDGSIGYKGQTFDVSAFPPSTLEEYPLLVLRRAPLGARPPANYERVRAGRYYDVWRRIPGSAAMTTEIPLTGQFAIPAADSCAAIAQLAASAPDSGYLVAAPLADVTRVSLGSAALPADWRIDSTGDGVVPDGPGTITVPFTVPADGTYEMWIEGSYPTPLDVTVDGTTVVEGARALEPSAGLSTSIGAVTLSAGTHELTLAYRTPWWMPGTDPMPVSFGPVLLTPSPSTDEVVRVPADSAASLCGRALSWVAVEPAP